MTDCNFVRQTALLRDCDEERERKNGREGERERGRKSERERK